MSIAVIGPNERRRQAVVSAVCACRAGKIRVFTSYPSGIDDLPRLQNGAFDVVMIDMDSDPEYALDLAESICLCNAATVMAFSAQPDQGLMLRCMHAGIREILPLPLSQSAMAEALVRAAAHRPEPQQPRRNDGRLLVFLGAKGGSGVTTLACNYAVSLAQESGQRTLFIDLDLPLGDAAINLGIKSQFSTVNALENTTRLDGNFLSTLLTQHDSGLYVLAAPGVIAPTQVSNEAIDRLLEVALEEFDYVVVDAGSKLDLQGTRLFDESATIYLVTQVGIPELRNANRLIAQFSRDDSPKLEIVINRYERHSFGVTEEHVTKALTRPPQWKVPNDYAAVRHMQNTAIPLTQDNSSIARAIKEMTRSVCSQAAEPEKKKRFALFG
ncbi:MAG: AAA family ATPase [Terracidiphilus sp.]|nr:AAA family ATPase [Terracidiphilus sp.]